MMRGAGEAPPRTRKARGSHRAAVSRTREEGMPVTAAGTAVQDRPAPSALLPKQPGHQPPGDGPAQRLAPYRALKNWRVRSRLILLVIIPTITAVVGGAVFIASSLQRAVVDQR